MMERVFMQIAILVIFASHCHPQRKLEFNKQIFNDHSYTLILALHLL